MKIRIKFAKEGDMKFIGHLDVMRYFQKVMRCANVDICYSGGFSPHQIMSFAAPLGVGLTSRAEYVDIEVHSTDSSQEMLRRINAVLVDDMEALSYRRLPDSAANAMSIVAAADYRVSFREGKEPEDWGDFAAGLSDFLAKPSILILKKTKKSEKEVDIRPLIYRLEAGDGHTVRMQVAAGSAANLRPETVIEAYLQSRQQSLAPFALMIHREEVYAARTEQGAEPFVPLEELGEDIE